MAKRGSFIKRGMKKFKTLSSNNIPRNPLQGLSKPIRPIPVTQAPPNFSAPSVNVPPVAAQNQGQDISAMLRQYIGGGGGSRYTMTPQQEAQAQIDLEYKPKESALQQALATARATTKQGIDTQQGFGDRQGANLQDIFGKLTAALQQNVGATGDVFDSSKNNTQQIFEQLASRQQNAATGVQDSLKANAEKMGLTAALDDPQKRLANTLSELQGFSSAQNQNIQGSIAAQGANEQAYGQRQVGASQQQGAQAQRDLQNQVAKAVAMMQIEGQGQENQFNRQLADLQGSKSTALNKLVNDITSARTATEKQDAQDAFAQYIQEQTLAIQQQRLGLDATKMQQGFGIDLARLGLDSQKLQAELANTTDPLKQQKLLAEIANLNARTSATQGTAGTATNSALDRFYNTPQAGYWGDVGAGPNVRNAINQIITDAANESVTNSQAGGLGPQVDPYTLAQAYVSNYPSLNPNALRSALQIYFGKTK